MALNSLDIYVLKPKEAYNLCTNPSFELTTTGWNQISATLARSQLFTRRGKWALEISPTTGGVQAWSYFSTVPVVSGKVYTFSADIHAPAGSGIQLQIKNGGGSLISIKTYTANGFWQRIALTYTETETANHIIYIGKLSPLDTAKFYVDGVQFEEGNESTYFDGDTVGNYAALTDYLWTGANHNSTSYRSGMTKNGGELVNLKSYGTITGIIGLGMAPVTNVSAPWRLYGSDFQKTIVNLRTFQIGMLLGDNTNLTGLQNDRKPLIDLLRPDSGYQDQPITLYFEGKDENGIAITERMGIQCFYSSGLEGNFSNQRFETVIISFDSFRPLLFADGEHAYNLAGTQTLTANYALHRDSNGNWDNLNITSLDKYPWCFAKTRDGTLYMSGEFTAVNGIANTSHIAKCVNGVWSALGTGLQTILASPVCMTVGPDGNLYVGGAFASAGGVANTANFAKWDGSAWSSVVTGFNYPAAVLAVEFSPNGDMIISGQFTTVGGISATNIARRSAAGVWTAFGTGLNAYAYRIQFIDNVRFIVAGTFTTANGHSYKAAVMWNGTDFIQIIVTASYNNGQSNNIFWDKSTNRLYYLTSAVQTLNGVNTGGFGYFGQILSGSTVFTNLINSTPGDPASATSLWVVLKQSDGSFLLGGYVKETTFGTGDQLINGVLLTDGLMVYRGGQFYPFEGNLPSTAFVKSGYQDIRTGDLYLGFEPSGTAIMSKTNIITTLNNFSSARAYPNFIITGPGNLVKIANETTKQTLTFNALSLSAGEVAILKFTQAGPVFGSNFRADLANTIIPGSATDFYLQPGTNHINVFMANMAGGSDVTMICQDAFWSLDGGQR